MANFIATLSSGTEARPLDFTNWKHGLLDLPLTVPIKVPRRRPEEPSYHQQVLQVLSIHLLAFPINFVNISLINPVIL